MFGGFQRSAFRPIFTLAFHVPRFISALPFRICLLVSQWIGPSECAIISHTHARIGDTWSIRFFTYCISGPTFKTAFRIPLNFDIVVPRSDQFCHKQRSAFHKQNLKQRSMFHSIFTLAFRVPTPLSISVPRSVNTKQDFWCRTLWSPAEPV